MQEIPKNSNSPSNDFTPEEMERIKDFQAGVKNFHAGKWYSLIVGMKSAEKSQPELAIEDLLSSKRDFNILLRWLKEEKGKITGIGTVRDFDTQENIDKFKEDQEKLIDIKHSITLIANIIKCPKKTKTKTNRNRNIYNGGDRTRRNITDILKKRVKKFTDDDLELIRNTIYDGIWELFLEDLKEAKNGKKTVFKIPGGIDSHISRIEGFIERDKDEGVNDTWDNWEKDL